MRFQVRMLMRQSSTLANYNLHVKELNAPSGLLSVNASEKDRLEACKILLSYTKADENAFYDVGVGEVFIHACPYPSRDEAKKYLI